MTTLTYLRTLERAWDRYRIEGQSGNGPLIPRVKVPLTTEQKVEHLTNFMRLSKAQGISFAAYEEHVGVPKGRMFYFVEWLMTGRLNVEPGELLDFFTARKEAIT